MNKTQSANRPSPAHTAYWLVHPEFRAFATAIRDNPKDDTPRLVAADWLQDRGDLAASEYAEFIRESVRCPTRLSRRAAALLEANLRSWVGPLFSTGKEGRAESISRTGRWVSLQLAYYPHPDWPMRVGSVRLRWDRGVVGRAEFGDREGYGGPNHFHRLAARVATACPAAAMTTAPAATSQWLTVSFRFRSHMSLTKLWRAAVNQTTAEFLPSAGPSGHVVGDNLFDRRTAFNFAQDYMTQPMTEFAHHLASVAQEPAPSVA